MWPHPTSRPLTTWSQSSRLGPDLFGLLLSLSTPIGTSVRFHTVLRSRRCTTVPLGSHHSIGSAQHNRYPTIRTQSAPLTSSTTAHSASTQRHLHRKHLIPSCMGNLEKER